jgi:hypothetical protein
MFNTEVLVITDIKRILILGAGEVGATVARIARKRLPSIRITLSDKDPARLKNWACEFDIQQCDLMDGPRLLALAKQNDILVNCTGPYYRFANRVASAALKSRTTYLDANDDWESTEELLGHSDQFTNAGVLALIGFGATPGVLNYVALMAAECLGATDEIITAWRGEGAGGPYSAAKEHFLRQCTQEIAIIDRAKRVMSKPLRPIAVPIGPRTSHIAYSIGHPEPVTLARAIDGLQSCINAAFLTPGLYAVAKRAARRIANGESVASEAANLAQYYSKFGEIDLAKLDAFPGVLAVATRRAEGIKQAVAVTATGLLSDSLGTVTAAPLVTALSMVLDGQISGAGVKTPEDCASPREFLTHYARLHAAPEATFETQYFEIGKDVRRR